MSDLPTAWISNIPILDKTVGQGQVDLYTSPPSGTYLRTQGSIPGSGEYFFGLHNDESRAETPYIFVQITITERNREADGDLFFFHLAGEATFFASKEALQDWRVKFMREVKREAKKRRMGV